MDFGLYVADVGGRPQLLGNGKDKIQGVADETRKNSLSLLLQGKSIPALKHFRTNPPLSHCALP